MFFVIHPSVHKKMETIVACTLKQISLKVLKIMIKISFFNTVKATVLSQKNVCDNEVGFYAFCQMIMIHWRIKNSMYRKANFSNTMTMITI